MLLLQAGGGGFLQFFGLAEDDGEGRSELMGDVGKEAIARLHEVALHPIGLLAHACYVPEHECHGDGSEQSHGKKALGRALHRELVVGLGHALVGLALVDVALQLVYFKEVVGAHEAVGRGRRPLVGLQGTAVIAQVAVVVGVEAVDLRVVFAGTHLAGGGEGGGEIAVGLGMVLHLHQHAGHGNAGLEPEPEVAFARHHTHGQAELGHGAVVLAGTLVESAEVHVAVAEVGVVHVHAQMAAQPRLDGEGLAQHAVGGKVVADGEVHVADAVVADGLALEELVTLFPPAAAA